MLIRLIVPGEIARVEDLNTSLEAVLTRHGIDPGVRADVRLIVEELASNAIEYGGDDGVDVGQHELSVDIGIDGDLLTLRGNNKGHLAAAEGEPDHRFGHSLSDATGLDAQVVRLKLRERSRRSAAECTV